jgi:hypothetical protein
MTVKIAVKCLAPKNYSDSGILKSTLVPVAFLESSFRSIAYTSLSQIGSKTTQQ